MEHLHYHSHQHAFMTNYDNAKQRALRELVEGDVERYDSAEFRELFKSLDRFARSHLAECLFLDGEMAIRQRRQAICLNSLVPGSIALAAGLIGSYSVKEKSNFSKGHLSALSNLSWILSAVGVWLLTRALFALPQNLARQKRHVAALQKLLYQDLKTCQSQLSAT